MNGWIQQAHSMGKVSMMVTHSTFERNSSSSTMTYRKHWPRTMNYWSSFISKCVSTYYWWLYLKCVWLVDVMFLYIQIRFLYLTDIFIGGYIDEASCALVRPCLIRSPREHAGVALSVWCCLLNCLIVWFPVCLQVSSLLHRIEQGSESIRYALC